VRHAAHDTQQPARSATPIWVTGALLATVLAAGFGAAAAKGGKHTAASAALAGPAVAVTPDTVADRLHEILGVHDAALLRRDEALLDSVFAPDCPCLEATRQRIRGLRANGLVWSDYRSTVSDTEVQGPRGDTWTVTAVLTGSPTRVETAARDLVRILPAERRRWAFHLRPAGGGRLLLTGAEPLG
jgi:hypothetical protein